MTVHVLHILGPLRPSGMERMLVTASSYLEKENIRSTVLGQGKDHSFEPELRAAGYDVRIIPSVGERGGARKLRSLVNELDIDVIHIHTEGNYLRTALASRWALGGKGSIVRTIHNVFDATGIWKIKRFIQAQIADRLVYALIAPSPEVARNETRIFRNVRVVFNWVDDTFFDIRDQRRDRRDSLDDNIVAVIVGNCSSIKNHELALKALVGSGQSVVHLGNEDDASAEELQLLSSLEAEGRLVDRGVKAPQDALLTGTYFMMPSRHEGMGVALAEALVAGVPALVNDAPGLQWARQIEGVNMLSSDGDAWSAAVHDWSEQRWDMTMPSLDLSAARGAREYAEVYRASVLPRASVRIMLRRGHSRAEVA